MRLVLDSVDLTMDKVMSRPKPTIILEHIRDDLKATQICEADAIYAVCYRGNPILMRTLQNIEVPDYPGPKYGKTAWANPGHAFNCAERLNALFKTEDFTVVKMIPGRTIREQ
jgi:hypothetical protein